MRRRRPGVLLDQQYLAKNPLSRLANRGWRIAAGESAAGESRLANRGWRIATGSGASDRHGAFGLLPTGPMGF
jgi:hypothetical protein